MQCVMIAAISKDGFLTKGDDPNPTYWTSKEDTAFLRGKLREFKLHVMGRKTYESYNLQPDPRYCRVILTQHPEQFADQAVPGQIEFFSGTPESFIQKYGSTYDKCLVLGGSQVFTSFLEAGLIDTCYLTIEPVLNQNGVSFLRNDATIERFGFAIDSQKTLNEKGTILITYTSRISS